MEFTTDYIVIEGDRDSFEKELNKISKKGYIYCGNMNTTITDKGVLYSQLMSKSEPIK